MLRFAAPLFSLLLAATAARAEPLVLRFGYPGIGIDNRPFAGGSIVGVAHANHYVEQEFANDPDIKVEWTFFRGAGPALNESLAAGHLDFAAGLGDLPAIVGRANGLKTKWLLTDTVRVTIYLAVRPDSGIKRIEDLAGHKLSQFKGTNLQLAADRVLAAHGLSEKNVHFLNLDVGNAVAALSAGDIDGSFGSVELFGLRQRGVVSIAYSTKGDDPTFVRNSAIYVTEAFEQAHPEIVQRVVSAFLKAARFAADENNRDAVFDIWSKNGIPADSYRADFLNETLAHRLDPLIDPYVIARYKDQAQRVRDYGLLRKDVDVAGWADRRYLNHALAEQHLEHFWSTYDAEGKKLTTGEVEHTATVTH